MQCLGNSESNLMMRWMPDAWPVFFHKRGPRPIQQNAIPLILKGESVFLTAPTASGKTEAVMAPLYQRHISFKHDHLSVLYVAPTKALVNDIYYRLSDYLGCGKDFSGICRYTGDHHDFKEPMGAFALIATPEALDSLQLRHPQKLEHIRAMVVDEVHFIHGKARGEQLRYVIDRVRSKSRSPLNPKDVFQVVAMSATLNDMESVGRLWVGNQVKYVTAEDPREIEMHHLPVPMGKIQQRATEIAAAIRNYIEIQQMEKVLIFANTRNDAHHLGFVLHDVFKGTRWPVYLHFGILETKVRDEIESDLKKKRYGICVCTSTLELGIDIGDIEAIMLLSPPPSVSSFLQRIGRGSRRSEICKVVTLVRNDNERVIYEALLDLARHGKLEPIHEYSRPSVAFQQILSHAWNGLRKEKPLTLKNLAARTGGRDFGEIVNSMLEEGHLKLNHGALIPSDRLIELGDRSVIHTVIAGDGAKPVYDGVTGDLIASIGEGAGDGLYFLGGTLRRIASGEKNSYVLEQVEPKGPRQIGKIPAARGGRGISRTLVWKIAEMTGHDPRIWSWTNDRLVTWGGWVNNLLLKFILEQHGYGTISSFDAFALEGIEINKKDEINPDAISAFVRNAEIHLSLREAEKFREPSRFYQYLSTNLKTKESESAIPVPEFTQWLNECLMGTEQTNEIEQEKTALAEECAASPHYENDDMGSLTVLKESVRIQTFSGIAFDLLNPKPEMILVEDIIHSLALVNRFNGAAKFPYSVAQHSLYVASLLPPELKLQGLLHDAAEAYVGDMVSPLKKIMTEYKEVETGIARVVAEVFGLARPAPPAVKKADLAVLSAEREQVLLPSYGPWYKNFPSPADIRIEPMSWVQVKEIFSSELHSLLESPLE